MPGNFPHPELIHADEGARVSLLEALPKGEIRHGLVLGKLLPETLQNMRRLVEAEELQMIVDEEARDLRQRHAMLLHVKEKVAEVARRIEIGQQHSVPEWAIRRKPLEFLAAAADIVGGGLVSPGFDPGSDELDGQECCLRML